MAKKKLGAKEFFQNIATDGRRTIMDITMPEKCNKSNTIMFQ